MLWEDPALAKASPAVDLAAVSLGAVSMARNATPCPSETAAAELFAWEAACKAASSTAWWYWLSRSSASCSFRAALLSERVGAPTARAATEVSTSLMPLDRDEALEAPRPLLALDLDEEEDEESAEVRLLFSAIEG